MHPRTVEGIALGPTGNIQGTQKVFCIRSGRVIKRRKIIPFHMPDRVIRKVNQWGARSKQEEYGNKLAFLNRNKEKYDWDNDDLADEEGLLELDPTEDLPTDAIPAEMPGIELEEDLPSPVVEESEMSDAERAVAAIRNDPGVVDNAVALPAPTQVDEQDQDDDDSVVEIPSIRPPRVVHEVEDDEDDDEVPNNNQDPPDPDGEEENNPAGLLLNRPRRNRRPPQNYMPTFQGQRYEDGVVHLNTEEYDMSPMSEIERQEQAFGIILLQQFGIRAGLRKFGKDGEKAISKELTQLYDMDAFTPVTYESLTKEEREQVWSL